MGSSCAICNNSMSDEITQHYTSDGWDTPFRVCLCRERDMKLYCECCGRQIIPAGGDYNTAPQIGAVRTCGNNAICGDCAKDLDQNGLFPEESAQ